MLRALVALAALACCGAAGQGPPPDFDEGRAYGQLAAYMNLSPLLPGSSASESLAHYLRSQLEPLGYTVEFDTWTTPDAPVPLRNIVATRGTGPTLHVIGAHYDTRAFADKDPDPAKRFEPVPGANDGGSGVAVLLELARSVDLPEDSTLRLAFFDAEDQGGIPGYGGRHGGWILGSTRMASQLGAEERARIAEVIIVDIVGDPQLRLVREGNSDPDLAERVWDIADALGHGSVFVDGVGAAILDDHIPFLELGLPVLDLIQLTGRDGSAFFPWHHTTLDTLDRVGRSSLGAVGRTLESFLEQPRSVSVPSRSPLGLRRPSAGVVLVLATLGAAGLLLLSRRRTARRAVPRGSSLPQRRGKRRRQ